MAPVYLTPRRFQLFLTRLCYRDLDVLPSVSLSRSPHTSTMHLIYCPPKGPHHCLLKGDPCVQRRAPRICTPQHHSARYVFATCVAPRDTDTTQVIFPITHKIHILTDSVDPEGVLRQITTNGLSVGRPVYEALRLVWAFQHIFICGGWR